MSIVEHINTVPPRASREGDVAMPGRVPMELYVAPAPTEPVVREGEVPGTWSEYEPKLQAAVLADTIALLHAESQRADAAEHEVARLRAMLDHPCGLPRRCTPLRVVDG